MVPMGQLDDEPAGSARPTEHGRTERGRTEHERTEHGRTEHGCTEHGTANLVDAGWRLSVLCYLGATRRGARA